MRIYAMNKLPFSNSGRSLATVAIGSFRTILSLAQSQCSCSFGNIANTPLSHTSSSKRILITRDFWWVNAQGACLFLERQRQYAALSSSLNAAISEKRKYIATTNAFISWKHLLHTRTLVKWSKYNLLWQSPIEKYIRETSIKCRQIVTRLIFNEF